MTQTDRDHHDHHDADQPTTTPAAPDEQRSEWPVPGWQWASLVAVLLGGQTILLVLTTWTLATSASHGWPTPIILALGLLARLVPDTLKLAEWAATAQTWDPASPPPGPPRRRHRRAGPGQPRRHHHLTACPILPGGPPSMRQPQPTPPADPAGLPG